MILYYETEDNTLYHHGVKGMKWGKRKSRAELEKQAGTFKASNGVKVAAAKNGYVRAMRNLSANRKFEKYSNSVYRQQLGNRHADTMTNRANISKGEQQMRKEAQAIREYNAHIKDLKKGTGSKHLDKAVRANKIDDAYEKVQTASSRLDRAVFGDSVRKKTAKYMVDNNMSMKDAKKKARKNAIIVESIGLAVVGGMTVAELMKQK